MYNHLRLCWDIFSFRFLSNMDIRTSVNQLNSVRNLQIVPYQVVKTGNKYFANPRLADSM